MKTVAFKIELVGDDEVLKTLDRIRKELEEIAKKAKIPTGGTGGAGSRTSGGGGAPGGGTAPGGGETTLYRELIALQKALKEGLGRTDEEYKKMVTRTAELKAQLANVNQEVRDQTAAFRAVKYPTGSMAELAQRLGNLRSSYRQLTEEERKSPFGRDMLKDIQRIDKEIKQLDGSIGNFQRNVGNYQSALGGLNKAMAGVTGFAVLGFGIQDLGTELIDLSEGLADVQKTTGLTEDQIAKLSDRLSKLDTRTSLNDLLDIARGGGQLGIGSDFVRLAEEAEKAGDKVTAALNFEKAQDQIEEFTKATNTVFVALGDELPGTATDIAANLGKLATTLDIEDERGVAGGILAIGTVVNELAATTKASAEPIVDFANRVSGLAKAAKLSAPDVLALGATFSELGQSQEVASTVLLGLLPKMGAETEKFAKLAGVPLEIFRKTLAEDGTAALKLVLEGAKTTGGGLEELATVVEDFGLDGARATQIVGVLANNLDILSKNQETARKEFETGTSVIDEYNVKNNNLAGTVEKVKKSLLGVFVNSGVQDAANEALQSVGAFIERVISAGAQTGEALKPVGDAINFLVLQPLGLLIQVVGELLVGLVKLPKFVADNKEAFAALGVAVVAFNFVAIKAAASALLLEVNLKRKALADRLATISQWNLNAAMNANPIGLVVGALALLVAGVILVYKNFDFLTGKVRQAWEWFMKIYDSNALVRGAFFGLVEPIKVIIAVFQDWQNIWAGVSAAGAQAITNLVSLFARLQNSASITALRVQKAFTFDGAKDAELEKQIQALTAQNERLADSAVSVGEAYTNAYRKSKAEGEALAKAQEEARKKAAATAKEATASRAADASTPDAPAPPPPLPPRKPTEEEIKKAAQNRADAEKKIRELTLKLIEDETVRGVEVAGDQFTDSLKNLVGTKDQRMKQAELLTGELAQELAGVYDAARKAAADKSSEALSEALDAPFLPSPEELSRMGEESRAALADQYAALFDAQRAAVESQATEALAVLPEGGAEAAAVRDRVRAEIDAINQAEAEAQRELLAVYEAQAAELLTAQVESIEQRAEVRKLENDRALAAEIETILGNAGATAEAQEEASELIEEAKREAAEREKEIDLEILEERAALLQAAGESTIDLQRQIVKTEIELAEEKARRVQDLEKQTTQTTKEEGEKRRRTTEASLNAFGGLMSAIGDALKEDEKNRKRYGAALKALALGEVAINLIREIAAIRAAAAALTGPFAPLIIAAQVAGAVVQAGVSIARIKKQQFRYGGTLPGQARVPLVGPASESGQGVVVGPGHGGGGVRVMSRNGNLVELEGGEYLLKNGDETYVINRDATQTSTGRLNELARIAPDVFDPEKKAEADRINRIGGGRSLYEAGGRMPVAAMAPSRTTPYVVSRNAGPVKAEIPREFMDQMTAFQEQMRLSMDATNARMDRQKVIMNRRELTVAIAESLKKIEIPS